MRRAYLAALAAASLFGCSSGGGVAIQPSVLGVRAPAESTANGTPLGNRRAIADYLKAHGFHSMAEAIEKSAETVQRIACPDCPPAAPGSSPPPPSPPTVNNFSSISSAAPNAPVDIEVSYGGYALLEVYEPDAYSIFYITLTYTNTNEVVYGTYDPGTQTTTSHQRQIRGFGASARDFLTGWILGHLLDWAIGHDVHGQTITPPTYAIPNSSPPCGPGCSWVPLPIIGPLPEGWVPAPNTVNPGTPIVPKPPRCAVAWIGVDCRTMF
jgi:hypothetical protein